MPRKLDPALVEIFKKYDEPVEGSVWDCHGTWVAYHKAVERIAAKANIKFDMPQVIECSSKDKTVAIAVQGHMGERSEWSFGEAAPGNNKNSYPYAMAEKRAKDRVVLKLIGLSGLVYSEEESDDFKHQSHHDAPTTTTTSRQDPKSSASWKRGLEMIDNELLDCHSVADIRKLAGQWGETMERDGWGENFVSLARDKFKQRRDALKSAFVEDVAETFDTETGELKVSDFPGDSSYHSTLQAG